MNYCMKFFLIYIVNSGNLPICVTDVLVIRFAAFNDNTGIPADKQTSMNSNAPQRRKTKQNTKLITILVCLYLISQFIVVGESNQDHSVHLLWDKYFR